MKHTVGYIGLGKMGQNMVLHLLEQGVDVTVYNRTPDVTDVFVQRAAGEAQERGDWGELTSAKELSDLMHALSTPRIIWLMVKAGKPVDAVIEQLLSHGLTEGDIIIDGGNSLYKDTVLRQERLKDTGIVYLDCGTSGGLEGARHGASLMIGGDSDAVMSLRWLWEASAVPDGWGYMGPSGAGHFVKMVHNGIEYGMNQAIGEGFGILEKAPYELDFARIARTWAHGSVIRGWLIELIGRAFEKDPSLQKYIGKIGGGSTGAWTKETAEELGVSIPVLIEALEARVKSQTTHTFSSKVVSALRFEYGGHDEEARE